MAYTILDISPIQPLNPVCEVDLFRRSLKSEVGRVGAKFKRSLKPEGRLPKPGTDCFGYIYFRPHHSAWKNGGDSLIVVGLHENWTLASRCQVSGVSRERARARLKPDT
jgi:hypothetical protein